MTPFGKGKDVWAEMVEQATKGRVKIINYHSHTLCKSEDTWTAVQIGIAHIGNAITGLFPGFTPLTDVILLPFWGDRVARLMVW